MQRIMEIAIIQITAHLVAVYLFFGTCANGHPFQWESSDKLETGDQKKLHIDNLHFALAIILSGNNQSKMEQFARFYCLSILRGASFHGYQHNYVCSGVDRFYKHQQVLCYVFWYTVNLITYTCWCHRINYLPSSKIRSSYLLGMGDAILLNGCLN